MVRESLADWRVLPELWITVQIGCKHKTMVAVRKNAL